MTMSGSAATESKAAVSEKAIERLAGIYQFDNADEVAAYLRAYPFLVDLLVEAREKIGEHFGRETPVVLEVFTFQDADDDQELFALVRTSLSPNEAAACLDRLDRDWWLAASPRAQCQMNVSVDFV